MVVLLLVVFVFCFCSVDMNCVCSCTMELHNRRPAGLQVGAENTCSVILLFPVAAVSILTDHYEQQEEYWRADEYNRLLISVLSDDFSDDTLRHSLLAYRQLKSVEVIVYSCNDES